MSFESEFDKRRREIRQRAKEMDEPQWVRQIREYVKIAEYAIAIRDSEASWETKHGLIFSSVIFHGVPELKWYDPETNEEAEVRAWVDALEEQAQEWRAVLKAIDGKGARDE